jgi:alpha-L-fucosidase 2
MFQPVGNLHLTFEGHQQFSNYRRELDIEKAVTTTTYVVGGVTYTREAFVSFPDRVIVVRLTADKANSLSFSATYSSPHAKKSIAVTPNKELTLAATTADHEGVKGLVRLKGIAKIKANGGNISITDTSVVVKNANTATIFISIATNFNKYDDISGDENKRASNI